MIQVNPTTSTEAPDVDASDAAAPTTNSPTSDSASPGEESAVQVLESTFDDFGLAAALDDAAELARQIWANKVRKEYADPAVRRAVFERVNWTKADVEAEINRLDKVEAAHADIARLSGSEKELSKLESAHAKRREKFESDLAAGRRDLGELETKITSARMRLTRFDQLRSKLKEQLISPASRARIERLEQLANELVRKRRDNERRVSFYGHANPDPEGALATRIDAVREEINTIREAALEAISKR